MSRALGFIGLLIVLGVGAYIYMRQAQSVTPGGGAGGATPRSTIDIVGVKNDLIALANAERRHFAAENKYVSIDELRSSGDISMPSNRRGPYEYSAETTDTGFRVTATYSGPPDPNLPHSLSIDESMEIKKE